MTDIERVKEMVSEGRITAEEGDQLIKVLLEVDDANNAAIDAAIDADYAAALEAADRVESTEGQSDTLAAPATAVSAAPEAATAAADGAAADGADVKPAAFAAAGLDAARDAAREAGREAGRLAREAAREARENARAARDAAREAARSARGAARDLRRGGPGPTSTAPRPGAAIAPSGTKWVTIEMIAGDLDVWAVDGLSGPEVEGGPGNVNVEDTADGYTVKFAPDRGGVLDRVLSHIRSGSLRVRVPSDHGVVVKATAGDVDLHGVRYLRGNLTAGDLNADGLEGIDFSSMAGDLDVAAKLTSGRHVLTVGAGDVEFTLDDRSDVTVDAAVSIGEASSDAAGFSRNARTVGSELSGQVGSGAAHLELRATTGDVDVSVRRLTAGEGETGAPSRV